MLFALICADKPDHLAVRQQNRPVHLAYLSQFEDRLFAAGPTFAEDGTTMNGSIVILDCADRAEAEAFAAGDPYAKAGLFARVDIRAWKKVLPA